MKRFIVACICGFMLLCLVGCETARGQDFLDEAMLSCVGKSKAEVFQILDVKEEEFLESEGGYFERDIRWGSKTQKTEFYFGPIFTDDNSDKKLKNIYMPRLELPCDEETINYSRDTVEQLMKEYGVPSAIRETRNEKLEDSVKTTTKLDLDETKVRIALSEFWAGENRNTLRILFTPVGEQFVTLDCFFQRYANGVMPGTMPVFMAEYRILDQYEITPTATSNGSTE